MLTFGFEVRLLRSIISAGVRKLPPNLDSLTDRHTYPTYVGKIIKSQTLQYK